MIYDLDDNPLSSGELTVESGEVKTLTVNIDCEPSQFLRAETVSDLTVEGKQQGESSYTNLETGGLDLTTWQGARDTFFIRLTAGAVTEITEHAFALKVGL
jgi:hypothetical protein